MDKPPEITPICMPKLGMEMTEGMLATWHVREGDIVARGDQLFDVETDKLSVEQQSEFEGAVRRIVGVEGETYAVGQLLAALASADVSDADIAAFVESYAEAGDGTSAPLGPSDQTAPTPPDSLQNDEHTTVAQSGHMANGYVAPRGHISPIAERYAKAHALDMSEVPGTGRLGRISLADVKAVHVPIADTAAIKATPLARRLAKQKQVDLSAIQGTGARGRIHRRDIENANPQNVARTAAQGMATPLSPMRKTIARRMVAAKAEAPHIYLRREVATGELIDIRARFNDAEPERKLTMTDFLIRAVALAQRALPDANVQFHGDKLVSFDRSDVSVAISTDTGLVSPVITGADRRTVQDVSAALRDLTQRSRSKALTSRDLEGGTITLTNLGMAGVRSFDAILNPPQAMIVAFGATEMRPANVNGTLALDRRMDITLSCDHRAIDGMTGAEFLNALVEHIENPLGLFSSGCVT
jgi:pyruvate dehydrogenase E2 component (dihydrolipoamide acetyltransferase)